MIVGKILDEITYWQSKICYKFAKVILSDYENGNIKCASCNQDIEKIRNIVAWIDGGERRKISSAQDYCIKFFIAENLTQYYTLICEADILKAYEDIQLNKI